MTNKISSGLALVLIVGFLTSHVARGNERLKFLDVAAVEFDNSYLTIRSGGLGTTWFNAVTGESGENPPPSISLSLSRSSQRVLQACLLMATQRLSLPEESRNKTLTVTYKRQNVPYRCPHDAIKKGLSCLPAFRTESVALGCSLSDDSTNFAPPSPPGFISGPISVPGNPGPSGFIPRPGDPIMPIPVNPQLPQ